METITPFIKDKVLDYLIKETQEDRVYFIYTSDAINELGIDYHTLDAIFSFFNRINITNEASLNNATIKYYLNIAEAHQLKSENGFVGRDILSKAQFEKLLTELEVLQKELAPDRLDTVNKLAGTASAIFAYLALYK